jgi:hypothetical protein
VSVEGLVYELNEPLELPTNFPLACTVQVENHLITSLEVEVPPPAQLPVVVHPDVCLQEH